jgi:hypothetical protein
MRVVKILLAVVALLVAAALVLAWTLPGDIAWRYANRLPGPVALTGIRGTVWNGHADGLSVFGRDLGELDWQVAKWPMLRGRVVADLRIKGADIDATGVATRERGGAIELRDVRFRAPASVVEPVVDLPDLHLVGVVDGVLAQARIEGSTVRDAAGNLRWSEAGVSGAAEARFSDVLADFSTRPDGTITGSVRDDGQGNLEIDGGFTVAGNAYDAQVRLAARNEDPRVLETLRYIGQPQADGSSLLVIHGRLFRLF